MSARFDVQKAEQWLEELRRALELDNHDQAYAALRAGLHALRDRLSIEETAHLAAQLPLVIRGVFFEGWHPSGKPIKVRRQEEFVALVEHHLAGVTRPDAAQIARAVFSLLQRHLTPGVMDNVERTLPKPIAELLHVP